LNPSLINASDPTMHLLHETNPNNLQLRLAQMLANVGSSSSTGLNNNNGGNNVDSAMNAIADMQRNLILKLLNDPMAAAQAATAAAMSATQIKANLSPISLITSHNKQIGSGRKRKSTPEKRVISNYRPANNNGDVEIFIFNFQKNPHVFHLDFSN